MHWFCFLGTESHLVLDSQTNPEVLGGCFRERITVPMGISGRGRGRDPCTSILLMPRPRFLSDWIFVQSLLPSTRESLVSVVTNRKSARIGPDQLWTQQQPVTQLRAAQRVRASPVCSHHHRLLYTETTLDFHTAAPRECSVTLPRRV